MLCTSVTIHPAPQVCRRLARRTARALSRPFTVALNKRRGACIMSIVPRPCQCPSLTRHSFAVPRRSCSCSCLAVAFLAASPRAIGRAARNTTKFRSILLEGYKEPKLRFTCHTGSHLRHHSRTGPSVGPQHSGFFTSVFDQQLIIFLLILAFRPT